jgi:hypothetical protein
VSAHDARGRCAFCRNEQIRGVANIEGGVRRRDGKGVGPSVLICARCVDLCGVLLRAMEEDKDGIVHAVLVESSPFEVGGRALEWSAIRHEWNGGPAVTVSVREASGRSIGARVFPPNALPSVEHAVETYRSLNEMIPKP